MVLLNNQKIVTSNLPLVIRYIHTYKGFFNRDITILSMKKTQKYLRYWVQIYCWCIASITFYEWSMTTTSPFTAVDSLDPIFHHWHTFRPERWQFRVGCCLCGRLKSLACWHRPVTWYGPMKRNSMALDRMNVAAIRPDHFSRDDVHRIRIL